MQPILATILAGDRSGSRTGHQAENPGTGRATL